MHIPCWGQKLLLGIGLTAALVVPVPASPGGPPLIDIELDYSPTEGLPGTTITFEGACPDIPTLPPANLAFVFVTDGVAGHPSVSANYEVDTATGEFGGAIETPSDAVPGVYDIIVECKDNDAGYGLAFFGFTVQTPPATTTTTTSSTTTIDSTSTTTSLASTSSTPPPAPPAPEVVLQPTFTG